MEDLKITVCFSTASEDELELDEERLFDTQPDTSMRKWQQSHTITSANKRQNLSISPEAAAISNNIDLVQTDKKIVYKPLQFPKRKQEITQPPATSRLLLNSRGTREKLLDRSTSNEHLTPETVTSNDLVQIEKKIIYRTLQLPKKRQEITKTPTVSRLILNAGAVTGTKEQQKHLERSTSKQHLAAINFDLVQADEKLVLPKKRQEIIKTPTILLLGRVTKDEHQHQERSTSKEHLVTKDFQTDERPLYKTVIQKKKIETATKTQTVSRLIYNDKQHTSGRATKDIEDRRSRSISEEHIYSKIDTSNEFDLIQSEDDEHVIPDYSNRVEKKKYPPTSTVSRLIYNDKLIGASTSKKILKDADLKLSDDEGKSMKLKSAVRVINNKTAVRVISKKTDVREISNNKIVREISNTSAYHEIKKSSETHRSKEFNEDKSPNSGFQKLMDIEVDIVDSPLPHKRRKESSKSQEYSEDEEHEYSSSKRKRYTSSQNSDSSSSEQHEYFKRNKPEYSKSKLSERTSTKKRNSSSSQERHYIKSSKPDYSKSKNPEYSNSKKQEYSTDEEREYLKNKKPEYSNDRRQGHSKNSKPQYSSTKKQEYPSDEEREHFNRNKPEYSKNKKPAESFSRRKQSEERVYFETKEPEYSNSRKPEFSNHRNQSTSRNPENSNYRKNENSNNANPGYSCSCKNNQNTNNNRDNGFPGFKNREFNKFSGNIRGNMGGGGGSRFNNNPKAGSSFSANRNNNNNNNNISNEYFGKVDLDLLRTDNNLLRRDNERLQRELEILQKKLEEKK